MPEHRYSGTRFRHDPANRGIFIHQPSQIPPWWPKPKRRGFGITLPLRRWVDQKVHWIARPMSVLNQDFPTYEAALKAAREFRAKHYDYYGECPIVLLDDYGVTYIER